MVVSAGQPLVIKARTQETVSSNPALDTKPAGNLDLVTFAQSREADTTMPFLSPCHENCKKLFRQSSGPSILIQRHPKTKQNSPNFSSIAISLIYFARSSFLLHLLHHFKPGTTFAIL
uniref:Uncharacterized protein n=1 Tax=Micrurus paraensis TaxID=1970185 RepID=A0A2D4L0E4_9SAUR